jgi:tetraacyldisaccharide 4'-kinase
MRAPDFWGPGRGGRIAPLVAPLTWLWRLGGAIKRSTVRPRRIGIPVICVGNLVAGGAGKTPICLDLAHRLSAGGCAVHLLTRGHGGRLAGPLRVDPARHTAAEVGDEALLLARAGPCWVARDRAAGARAAEAAGADLLVMDDGFQNPSLEKDLSLLVVDGGYGFGNGRVIPAGPLREPVEDGLARAGAAVLMGPDRLNLKGRLAERLPVLTARTVPTPEALALKSETVLAFAGIGRPAKFLDTLNEIGCRVVALRPFPDHHRYTEDEIMRLAEAAIAAGATLVTTEKDLVRLPAEAQAMATPVGIEIAWDDEAALDVVLAPLRRAASRPAPSGHA